VLYVLARDWDFTNSSAEHGNLYKQYEDSQILWDDRKDMEDIWNRKFNHVTQESDKTKFSVPGVSDDAAGATEQKRNDGLPVKKLATPEPAEEVVPDSGDEDDIMP